MKRSIALGGGHEFDIIRRMVARWGELAAGIGDDAATLDVPSGEQLVVSTDSSVEHVHFRDDWLATDEIGYRATTAALSDLAAMGAHPLGITVALSLPRSWAERIDDLADGIAQAVRGAGTCILGGDITRADVLVLGVTVLGATARPLRRDAARVGHAVYVTGVLGGPLCALRSLESGATPDAACRARFAHPVARIAEALWLAERGACAAIDISDGLVGDVGHIAAASGVRIELDLDSLTIVQGSTPLDAARSGEEYELVVTCPSVLDVTEFAHRFGIPLTAVGRIVDGEAAVDARSRGERVASPGGFDHFS